MHLRPPSIDHGVASGLWAVVLGFLILLGMLGLGVERGTSFIVSGVAACAIFLFVRMRGEEQLRR